MEPEHKPWWSDGDKIGAVVATIVLLALSIVILAGAIWVVRELLFS